MNTLGMWAATIALTVGASASMAQALDCLPEIEPNDAPDAANAFAADCIGGTLGDDDRQDLWHWAIDTPGTRRGE